MNIMSLKELKQKVTDKNNKMKLIHAVWLCLKYVEINPIDKCEIGIFWLNDKEFMLNSSIFGNFTDIKPNTMNRNFRTHGFCFKKSTSSIREHVLKMHPNTYLPDPKNWIIRWCEKFSKSTTEAEAKNWKYNEIIVKNHKNKRPNDNKNICNTEIVSNDIKMGDWNTVNLNNSELNCNTNNNIENLISFDIFDDFYMMRNDGNNSQFNDKQNESDYFPNILDSVDPFEQKGDIFQRYEKDLFDIPDEKNDIFIYE